jgi:murein DD-endopeptidase MepM/ murein hydrolase activator NlpD
MRRGVLLLVLGVLAAAVAAADARADGTGGTTTAGTTTVATTTAATPSYGPLRASYLPSTCVGAGAAAIAMPGSKVLALGTPASSLGPSGYPSTSPAVAFDSAAASGSTCKTAGVTLSSVSLFGGFVKASTVSAVHGQGSVSGLEIDGSPVSVGPGQSALLGYWGQLTLGRTVGRVTAPLVVLLLKRYWSLPAGTEILVGFSAAAQPIVRTSTTTHHSSTSPQQGSTTPSGGTTSAPAQTTSGPAAKAKKHRHRHHKPVAQPLTTTPPLGFRPSHYVFPVNGGADYGDTYGAGRSDIYDGWHHGDDLFASLGTPVVAVANGKLSLVGWNELGGWRLWLTDADGNSFYYAHLAGYSRWILKHPNVKAGQVVGFLGRTGDAFTTDPHLHFEIHPHQYLGLGYDGAVDPTAYLQKWRVVNVPAKEMPNPAKLKAPVGTPEQEATVVWRELLAARHLLPAKGAAAAAGAATVAHPFPNPPSVQASGIVSRPPVTAVRPTAARVSASQTDLPLLVGGPLGAVLALASLTGVFFFRRRRRTSDDAVAEAPPAVEPAA